MAVLLPVPLLHPKPEIVKHSVSLKMTFPNAAISFIVLLIRLIKDAFLLTVLITLLPLALPQPKLALPVVTEPKFLIRSMPVLRGMF